MFVKLLAGFAVAGIAIALVSRYRRRPSFYMYAEHLLGEHPSRRQARAILSDFDAGRVYIHATTESGWHERLQTIASGGTVDAEFFLQTRD